MGQVLHGSARTTEAIRRAIQRSEESVRALARRYSISPTTVQKWRKRDHVCDRPTGPSSPRSSVLTAEDEAMIVAFRRHSLLPLDDCLYALQPTIPHLTRSSLHRCLQRHGISRLPDMTGDKRTRRTFKAYPIGFFHIDIAEVRTAEGKLYLFAAIDRTSKFAFVQLVEKATWVTASAFLVALIAAVPYRIHTVLTDNGIQFCFPPRYANGPTASFITHMFDMRCREHGIEHRLTKPNHPWTNGQVERMNAQSRTRPSNATITTITISCVVTSCCSSTPTTRHADSRPCAAPSRPNSSGSSGRRAPVYFTKNRAT